MRDGRKLNPTIWFVTKENHRGEANFGESVASVGVGRRVRGLPYMTSALRGERVPSKADIVSNLSKGGCVNLRRRGEGSKNQKFLWTS